ncbi:MAG: hypothetical protein Q8R25_01155 [bacterium]|nr:hypothetical protein [bacterium]
MIEKMRMSPENKESEEEFLRRCDSMVVLAKRLREKRNSGQEISSADENEAYNQPVPEYAWKMGNSTVSLAGYWHEPEYFEKNEQQVRRHIGGATILVTELARLAEGALSDKTIEVQDDFFEEVERVAWESHVPVVSNDQHLHHRIRQTGLFGENVLQDRDKEIGEVKIEVFLAALAVTTGALGLGVYGKIKDQLENKTMSRRSFLVGGVAAGIATLSAASLYGTILNVYGSTPDNRRDSSPVGPVLFDASDYRDVATAYTISSLAKSLPPKSRVAVVYGVGHMRAVKHYLDNPTELTIKMALYAAAYGDTIPESIVFTPTGMDVSRKYPNASWTRETQDAFVDRKQKESLSIH